MKLISFLKTNPLTVFLAAIPLALLARYTGWGALWVFVFSTVSIIPLASLIGKATESLAVYTGPKIGGLLNATLGNAAELIITLVAIRAGYLELVKASITGSIIGNILLVLGVAMIAGGVKHGTQRFDQKQSGHHAVMLTLAVLALVIPSFFSHAIGEEGSLGVEILSLGVAVVMILLYGLGLFYSLKIANSPVTYSEEGQPAHSAEYSRKTAIMMLAAATLAVVFMSELLVGAIEAVVTQFGISEFFLGIILIPVVGNAAEHFVAVQVAARNKMDLSVEIAISSSLQIALFVAPVLVFISLFMGHPLTLIFNSFELMALGAGVLVTIMVSADGESNWMEGTAMVAVYAILALAFFLLKAA
jgi:Ca2+:H+ antiporter